MLLLKTKIGPSKIHGIGLFADQFIPKGTIIWKYCPGLDLVSTKDEIQNLPKLAQEQFLKYSYFNRKRNKYIFCFDDSRFMNHSNNPNTIDAEPSSIDEETDTIAARDIKPEEEITCDYRVFDGDFEYKMARH